MDFFLSLSHYHDTQKLGGYVDIGSQCKGLPFMLWDELLYMRNIRIPGSQMH